MSSQASDSSLNGRQLAHDLRTPIAALLAVETHLDAVPHDVRALLREAICRLQNIAERVQERAS